MLCRAFLAMSCWVWLAGCASQQSWQASADGLARQLQALEPEVAPAEARLAADTAHTYSLKLAEEYHVVRPALLHNVCVNLGFRQRGLCYQWADDLTDKLQSLGLRTLVLHRGVARLETSREHSSVVLTAPGQDFKEGIVLDAWRHSGHLFWSRASADKYPWIEVEVKPLATNEPASAVSTQKPGPRKAVRAR